MAKEKEKEKSALWRPPHRLTQLESKIPTDINKRPYLKNETEAINLNMNGTSRTTKKEENVIRYNESVE